VVLVGPAGAGKSTFARARFGPTEVLSSDFCRALVADDEGDQSASADAFAVLRAIATRRLRRGRVTVIDATNVKRTHRRPLLRLAERSQRPAIAIVFDLPLALCLERNRLRADRQVDEETIRDQWIDLPRPASELLDEGFVAVYEFHEGDDAARAELERVSARNAPPGASN
jgi:predicted kinase